MLFRSGIVTGTTGLDFEPQRVITRAEFVNLLMRALGICEVTEESYFNDVNKESWYTNTINVAYEKGIINGYSDGSFNPNQSITRQEAVVMVNKVFYLVSWNDVMNQNEIVEMLSDFKDSREISTWAQASMAKSVQKNIIKGNNNYISPTDNISRGEAAMLIYNFIKTSGISE